MSQQSKLSTVKSLNENVSGVGPSSERCPIYVINSVDNTKLCYKDTLPGK